MKLNFYTTSKKSFIKSKFIYILLFGIGKISFASIASPVVAEMKTGLSMGKNTAPQPVIFATPFNSFKECFALGWGSLVNERLQISLEKMTCSDTNFFYEYQLESVWVSDNSGMSGISTKHIPPSQSLLNSTKGLKDLYTKIEYGEGLKLIADAELGHWDVEPRTPVQIYFATEPKLVRRIPMIR